LRESSRGLRGHFCKPLKLARSNIDESSAKGARLSLMQKAARFKRLCEACAERKSYPQGRGGNFAIA